MADDAGVMDALEHRVAGKVVAGCGKLKVSFQIYVRSTCLIRTPLRCRWHKLLRASSKYRWIQLRIYIIICLQARIWLVIYRPDRGELGLSAKGRRVGSLNFSETEKAASMGTKARHRKQYSTACKKRLQEIQNVPSGVEIP